jgi:hypothetical protein
MHLYLRAVVSHRRLQARESPDEPPTRRPSQHEEETAGHGQEAAAGSSRGEQPPDASRQGLGVDEDDDDGPELDDVD